MRTYKETLTWLRGKKLLNRVFLYHATYPEGSYIGVPLKDVFTIRKSDFIMWSFIFDDTLEGEDWWWIQREYRQWYNSSNI